MNWSDCFYKEIGENLSQKEIDTIIGAMVDNYDNIGKFYDGNKAKEFLFHYIEGNSCVINLILNEANKDNQRKENRTPRSHISNIFNDDLNNKWYQDITINRICSTLLNSLEKEAVETVEERKFFRLKKGDTVDFLTCQKYSSIKDKVEFLKDGGWGIAEENGKVLVRNHLKCQPSLSRRLSYKSKCQYLEIQDCDTSLFGVLSIVSYTETLLCLYEKIEPLDNPYKSICDFFIKVKKNGKWGCYNSESALLIDCKYDDIKVMEEFIEGYRDGEYFYSESTYIKYAPLYDGKRDIYDLYGNLLIGGYDYFDYYDYKYDQIFKFYFGSKIKDYTVTEKDFYDNEIELTNYSVSLSGAVCLLLDSHFKSVLKYQSDYYRFPYRQIYNSVQELESNVPNSLLFEGNVDVVDFKTMSLLYIKKH